MPDRRGFLSKLAVFCGGLIGTVLLPNSVAKNDIVHASVQPDQNWFGGIQPKQSDLLAACHDVAKRMGVFRDSTPIWHYANDGEIEMTWTMNIPPENTIDGNTDALAQKISALANSN